MEKLQAARIDTAEFWTDDNHRRFEAEYLGPLEAKLRRTLDGVSRLAQVLNEAEKQCRSR
jgi:hypothetical protein